MEFEDSRNALFVEPNAYIQGYNINKEGKERRPQKVVFQEPYDCLPSYYVNNGFKKGSCECVPKAKPKQSECKSNSAFRFDVKSLMPLLGMFNKNAGGLSNILSALGDGNKGLDLGKIISSLMQNGNGLSSILNLLKGNKSSKENVNNIDLKSTDFEINNYTKV